MKKSTNKSDRNKKIQNKKKDIIDKKMMKMEEENKRLLAKKRRNFVLFFLIWISIFAIGLVRKTLQNDTFYTIEIGELILNNGIDMLDHFSFHSNLAYTYPHWLYDVFIYLCYMIGGYTAIHISSILILILVLFAVFKTNMVVTDNNYSVSGFATIVCALAVGGFATARAQLVSFLIFALEVLFIELFLRDGKKRYLFGLLILSLLICNIHVATWPFYFIVYLPYLGEFVASWIVSKIKIKKETKFIRFLKAKFVLEKNKRVGYLFITMLLSILTGFMTPLGDTPFTYSINMIMSNAQEYVKEHQRLGWAESPFTIIIAFETIFLALFSKVKLRDLFMMCGLVLMSILSLRHLSLLALIGTICFARIFSMFFESFEVKNDDMVFSFLGKKIVFVLCFVFVIVVSSLMLNHQLKNEFVASDLYPVEAVKYIKENIDVKEMRIFNEYNFGSYLLHHDIPVFIDSRAELYTSEYSGFDYDIFDDYFYITNNYSEKFDFYDITHVLIYKKIGDDQLSPLYVLLDKDSNYKTLYEDDNFILYEKNKEVSYYVTYN